MTAPAGRDHGSIERLDGAAAEAALDELAALLFDVFEGGASVNFIPPFGLDDARAFFRKVVAGVAAGTRVLLVWRDADGRIAGSVQMDLATPPNQRHRADVMKLLVFRAQRRRGIARALMQQIEVEARREGRTLLVLDTERQSAGEAVYRALGWIEAGVIPGYALNGAGSALIDTVYFYKHVPA